MKLRRATVTPPLDLGFEYSTHFHIKSFEVKNKGEMYVFADKESKCTPVVVEQPPMFSGALTGIRCRMKIEACVA